MSFSIFKYYYFLSEDPNNSKADDLAQTFHKNDFRIFTAKDKPILENLHQRFYQKQEDNIAILAVSMAQPEENWNDYLQALKNIEVEARLTDEDWLFHITVFISNGSQPWNDLLSLAQGYFNKGAALDIPLQQGHLARLGSRWPQSRAGYLLDTPAITPLLFNFLSNELPRMEAGLFRLNMISNLFRDRISTINKELKDFSGQLSTILHTQLVRKNNNMDDARNNMEMLENQIRDLSHDYGILATDFNTINDSYHRMQNFLIPLEKAILNNKALLPSNKIYADEMLKSYHSRLADLTHTLDSLRLAQENYRAAIEVVRSRIDIMLSRENVATQGQIKNLLEMNTAIQKQSLVFQVAAGIVEFVIIAYYSHSLWKNIAHISDYVSPGLQFIITILLSGNIVYSTHLLAEYAQGDHHVKPKLYTSVLVFILILAFIIASSVYFSAHVPH